VTIQEFLMKAAEDDARRAGERNGLLREALRVRAINRRRPGRRAAIALTRLLVQSARSAGRLLSRVLAAGLARPRAN
jgi:hypothetical protein